MVHEWFRCLSPDHPSMSEIFNLFGPEGYGYACMTIYQAYTQNCFEIDPKRLSRWLNIRMPKAEKLMPYFQKLLSDYHPITKQSISITKQSDSNPVGLRSDYGPITSVTDASNPRGRIKEEREEREERIDNKKQAKKSNFEIDFNEWWNQYPNKVGKGQALNAYRTALGKVEPKILFDGVTRYIQTKESWRKYQNPATWLRGEGWLDEPAKDTSSNSLDPHSHAFESQFY